MGILQGLERRLRGAVDTTFARIFGGSVQPAEVTAALQHEAALRLTHQAGRAIAPNRYTVELGPSDSADVGDDIRRVSAALSTALGDYVHGQGWDTYAAVQVTLRESPRLHTGQFRISSIVDPSIGRQHPSAGHYSQYDAAPGAGPSGRGEPGPGYGSPSHPPYRQDAHPHAAAPGPGYPNAYPPPAHGEPAYAEPAYGEPASRQSYPDPGRAGYPYSPPDNDPRPAPPDAGTQPALIVEDGTGRSYPLRRGSNVVGRGQDAALRLADTAVSREHIDVYFDGRIAIVHDLGSTNGTTVNGSLIQTWQLADGDVIRLGTSTVIYSAR